MLNPNIAMTLIMYDIQNFRTYKCLSTNWNFLVQEGMDQIFKKIEVDFINKYYEHLEFKSSFTDTQIIYASGRCGIRVDRVLVCELLDNQKHINKCLRASYAYRVNAQNHFDDYIYLGDEEELLERRINSSFCRQRRQKEHCADFKMDILPAKSSRLIWLHRD